MWTEILPFVAKTGMDFWGSKMNADAVREGNALARLSAQENVANQERFAKEGIRWRVADAKAAGIHPLYALGANTNSFTPVSVGHTPDTSMGDFVKGMGQDLTRAVSSTRTEAEKEMAALQISSAKLDVEGKSLDNQIRASQLQKLSLGTPSFPSTNSSDANFIPGQGNSGLVKIKPSERTASQPGRLAQEAGWRPDVSFSRTDTGLVPMVPESLSESLEDDIIGKLMWRVRNQLVPNITGGGKPAKSQLPRGASDWYWSHGGQEWRPSYNGSAREQMLYFFNK